ncbi:1-(5-phosphoribosyl)-5-amino-4-imidazole-carboxylate carboxylase [Anoxybacter fermentans]|uniref:1-(5-phosphoribosyl)-5-amino-4-imidazole-carboxylate carboxylase n=1 Tax=Anoxybacter fermentans TaxID=1323375 RepID=A0A3S9T0S3_9FIRM|nr:nickel pincer cofactor biosynthesis protein LarB [Anoxybacter fermentans]AZR74168.1 1-(5-phosphoribosyl)-5-amino-4-imidazole-carboxylate carboxylase [Anoxybacter fermentans]
MDKDDLRQLLNYVKEGKISIEEAIKKVQIAPFEDLGFVKFDHHRHLRQGFPEVILGLGKTPEQVVEILKLVKDRNHPVLATRCNDEIIEKVSKEIPEAEIHELARCITLYRDKVKIPEGMGKVLVISAGTGDLPVAEEAVLTLQMLGNPVEKLYDVGVAGIHRLFENYEKLLDARVLIVIAGMEGALASVVGGLVDKPVIAVPTSVGYGVSFNGLAALLGMLNSCSAGIGVVNIDNGFGAAFLANSINRIGRNVKK